MPDVIPQQVTQLVKHSFEEILGGTSAAEVIPEEDVRLEDDPLEDNPQESLPIHIEPWGATKQESTPVEGHRVPESTLGVTHQDDCPMEDSPAASTEEPTMDHPIPIPDPPTPTPLHNMAETASGPRAPSPITLQNPGCPPPPLENTYSEPSGAVVHPIQSTANVTLETTPESMVAEDMTTEKITPETVPEDITMEEATLEQTTQAEQDMIPEDMDMEEAPIEHTPQQEMAPENMDIEEARPEPTTEQEMVPDDAVMEEAAKEHTTQHEMVPEDMITEEDTPPQPGPEEVIPDTLQKDMDIAEGAGEVPLPAKMEVDQKDENVPKKKSVLAIWHANLPLECRGEKRPILPNHSGGYECSDEKRRRQGNQQAVYPGDVNIDRFKAEVRLFPPVRLQLMLNDYVAALLQEHGPGLSRLERKYLERVIRTPEQSDKDYSFDALCRSYVVSRPHDQRAPPFTLDEAVNLVTGCVAAAIPGPHAGLLVRRVEQDFRNELQKEVKQRHEELKVMSWSSSWFCPRENPPHLAADPMGRLQRFSRDYTRRFIYSILDEDNLRSYGLRERDGIDTKEWIADIKRRSDFVSIRDPETPWCIRRAHNFQLVAKWDHKDMKDCRGFIGFTNMWFGECIADGSRSASSRLFARFDKDRCDWLRHYPGTFPQHKE